jgi:hypothetical protein
MTMQQNNDPNLDSVINRIQKLMALTEGRGATEAEAALAASHVQRLLAEHNLSMAHIEASGGSSGADGKRERTGVNRKQVYKWQRELMAALAELNYCKPLTKWEYRNGGKLKVFAGYELIGRSANVATTAAMFDYLLQAIERVARDEVQDPALYFTRYAHSFKEGAAVRLVERLQQRKREIVEQADREAREAKARASHPGATSGAMVIFMSDVVQDEEDANNDLYNGLPAGTTAAKRRANEAENAAREAKRTALVQAGEDPDVAWYLSWGYDEERARKLATPEAPKVETEAERNKREARERRENERWQEREYARQRREANRLDPAAYRKGKQAGDDIGLDTQIEKQERKRV